MDLLHLDKIVTMEARSSLAPWSKNMFREEMGSPHSCCFVLEPPDQEDHSPMGFLCFRILDEESDLMNLCVHPQYRRLGLGRRLLAFYTEHALQQRVRRFYLETSFVNLPAIQLYRSFSYDAVGVRPKYYQGKFDALVMMKRV
jgi:[ribosomal protein S18]-alanine N-acetyltransferase